MLTFIHTDHRATLTADSRADMIAAIKGHYGFMKLTGRNFTNEADAFVVYANGEKLGTVSRF